MSIFEPINVYLGRAVGPYEEIVFRDFVLLDMGDFLQKQGINPSSSFEEFKIVKKPFESIFYFFPSVRLGIEYILYPETEICGINILPRFPKNCLVGKIHKLILEHGRSRVNFK